MCASILSQMLHEVNLAAAALESTRENKSVAGGSRTLATPSSPGEAGGKTKDVCRQHHALLVEGTYTLTTALRNTAYLGGHFPVEFVVLILVAAPPIPKKA